MNINKIIPTAAVVLADKARKLEAEGTRVIKLQTGDPDFATHECIVEAAYTALQKGMTHYSFSQGLPELRNHIAGILNTELPVAINNEWILISNGAAQGIYSVMAAMLEKDDEVIVLEPNWPTVDSLAILLGAKVKKVSMLEPIEEILLSLNSCRTEKTKLLCINTPNNPTGLVLAQEDIDRLCSWAKENDIYILADEVYRYLQHEGFSTSLNWLAVYPKYIFADSFSKKFAMTGWRLGYLAAHPDTLKKILKASQLTITHVAPFVQMAGLAALETPASLTYAESMKEEYQKRRKELCAYCTELNLEYIEPRGAFYLFVKLRGEVDDVVFSDHLLAYANTCIVPGSAFGEAGKGYVRISYANETDEVMKGLYNIAQALINL